MKLGSEPQSKTTITHVAYPTAPIKTKGIILAAHLLTFRCAAALGWLIKGFSDVAITASLRMKALPRGVQQNLRTY